LRAAVPPSVSSCSPAPMAPHGMSVAVRPSAVVLQGAL
jgi:hypothetical protein